MTSFYLQDSTDDSFADSLCDYLSNVTGSNITMAIESQASFSVAFNDAFFSALADHFRRSAGNLEVVASLVTAGVTGALSVTFIAVSYLPSYVITVLKFRSGVLGSLHDRRSMYLNKMNPFFATLLVGSSFWGAAFSGAATGMVSGSIVFLLLWDESKAFAEAAIAVFVVVISTTLLRIAVVSFIYTFVSRGFLRNKPATHNFIVLLFEAWNVGNSLGYVISRSFRVLLITLFYLGRLDKWVLADGAGEVHCFHPDIFPRAFNRDLLVHEAHRHPWAERLVTMYMLKIRNGKEFGSRAGGCWRLIFVSALMPWLIGCRVSALPEGITRTPTESAPESHGDAGQMDDVDDTPALSRTGYENIRLLPTLA
ncbi:hypothetical protein MHU86_5543 [Fragilaria crotonensis]|nr:hypothetical protein MHU86_5543 [Fragilaria crotonensis]